MSTKTQLCDITMGSEPQHCRTARRSRSSSIFLPFSFCLCCVFVAAVHGKSLIPKITMPPVSMLPLPALISLTDGKQQSWGGGTKSSDVKSMTERLPPAKRTRWTRRVSLSQEQRSHLSLGKVAMFFLLPSLATDTPPPTPHPPRPTLLQITEMNSNLSWRESVRQRDLGYFI